MVGIIHRGTGSIIRVQVPVSYEDFGAEVCVRCGVNATPSKYMQCWGCTLDSIAQWKESKKK